MSTMDSKVIIDQIIANNGYYETDPRVAQIVEFENFAGNTTWGVTWSSEPAGRQRRYEIPTEYVRNPRVIWRAS